MLGTPLPFILGPNICYQVLIRHLVFGWLPSLESCDGHILPVKVTLRIRLLKQAEHSRVLYMENEIILPHLNTEYEKLQLQ